jgi:guanylate kinase
MIVCVGASASGKTELAKNLYHHYGYKKCVTTTTRERRIGEKNDIDYHFLTKEQFESLMKNEGFFEVTVYNQTYYGIQKKDVSKDGIIIVDPNGANTLIDQLGKDVFVVYVKASEDTRRKRMHQRLDDPKLIEKRIENDRVVFKEEHITRIDMILNNDQEQIEELAKKVHLAYQTYMSLKG